MPTAPRLEGGRVGGSSDRPSPIQVGQLAITVCCFSGTLHACQLLEEAPFTTQTGEQTGGLVAFSLFTSLLRRGISVVGFWHDDAWRGLNKLALQSAPGGAWSPLSQHIVE
jgi:hypothetical protein